MLEKGKQKDRVVQTQEKIKILLEFLLERE